MVLFVMVWISGAVWPSIRFAFVRLLKPSSCYEVCSSDMVTPVMGTRNVVTEASRSIGESHQIFRAFSQSPDERVLPEWLNAAKGTTPCKRVMQIIETIRRIDEITSKAFVSGAYRHIFKVGSARRFPKNKLEMQRASDPFFAKLDRMLDCYTFRVKGNKLLSPEISGGWLPYLYCHRQKDDFGVELEYGKYETKATPGTKVLSRATYRVLEGDAVLAVLRLAQRGMLGRVRLCQRCSEKWLFAEHSNYRFCSRACRESYYTSTEEYREKKKIQMKQYRERLARSQAIR